MGLNRCVMEWKEDRMDCAKARELDMVAYLSTLGIEPIKSKGNNYWYLSPLRNEKTASFKINRKLNRWYDFGMGSGGNLIDFAILFHGCTVGEFIKSLQGNLLLKGHTPLNSPVATQSDAIHIRQIKPLVHPALLHYLFSRCIPVPIAKKHCREIHFEMNGKNCFAIGFLNDAGGYELRNVFFKGSSSPKAITHLKNGAETLAVFEGFMDYLSYLTMPEFKSSQAMDFLILNGVAFFKKSLPLMNSYNRVMLYLDNDTAGQNCSRMARLQRERFTDESSLYKNENDLNDFLVNRSAKYKRCFNDSRNENKK